MSLVFLANDGPSGLADGRAARERIRKAGFLCLATEMCTRWMDLFLELETLRDISMTAVAVFRVLVELSKDVSMFVCEATAEKAGYWGHLSVEEHRRYRQKLTPKQLVLSHLSKNALDAARADAQAYDWTVAYDGLKLPLNPT